MKTSVNMCNISMKLHSRTYRPRVRWDVWSLWLWCNSLGSKVLRSNTSLAIAFLFFFLQYRFIIDLKLNQSKPRWNLMAKRNAIKEDLKSGSRFRFRKLLRACLHEGGGPQIGEVKFGGSPHLSCKHNQIKIRDYMDGRVISPKWVTSPTWGLPPPCKQALKESVISKYWLVYLICS